jgi:hypothetical protein
MTMKIGSRNTLVLLVAAVLTAACTGIPRQERDHEQLERYLQYAGPPLDRITYLGRYDGWQALGRYQLVLWTNINDAYLITVRPPCEDLQFADHIGVTKTASTIDARFDSVIVRHWKCQIAEIRPIDYRRMKNDLRAQREQAKAAAAK